MKMSTFFYFGFGSNMLAQRIHIQNPTAVRIGPGRLDDYRLDFFTQTSRWQGAPATVVPTQGCEVHGAIWEIDRVNLNDLDIQEGVELGIYVPINLPVWSIKENKDIICRLYHLRKQPSTDLRHLAPELTPEDRQPSETYLKTLVKGAIETGVPDHYVQWLRTLRHNGNIVHDMEHKLELKSFDL